MAVTKIARICLITADPDTLARFYCRVFGFEPIGAEDSSGTDFGGLIGLADARTHALLLRLGGQTLELLSFAERGAPYPAGIDGTDPRFQHFAIVVADMAAAYARLQECSGWGRITQTAPQRLPASSGGVSAFKFRDPEGHPLELLAFPSESEPPYWRRARAGGPCLGIDHSAMTVTSTAHSVDFFRRLLGWSVRDRSLNRGPEQALLDDVPQPIVEVTALQPSSAPPHLELLCYRGVARGGRPLPRPNDVAATQVVVEVDDFAALMRELEGRAGISFISKGTLDAPQSGASALIREPDGHILRLVSSKPVPASG